MYIRKDLPSIYLLTTLTFASRPSGIMYLIYTIHLSCPNNIIVKRNGNDNKYHIAIIVGTHLFCMYKRRIIRINTYRIIVERNVFHCIARM